MKERHLRLIVSECSKSKENTYNLSFLDKLKIFFNCLFITKNEKIYFIKDFLIKLYRDYEITTGIVDIPYFVRAERRISQIIKDRKINYYYNRLKKLQNDKLII